MEQINEIRRSGIDYFGLSVDFLDDVKIRKVVRVCGAKSIAVLVRLLINCYRFEGYWIEWNEDVAFFIAEEFGVKKEFVQDVVQQALNVGFFDTNIFTQRSILTSKGIQSRFFEATARRRVVYYDATLMSAGVIIPKNAVNVDISRPNVDISEQSKVKESKGKESKEKKHIATDKPSRGELFSWLDTLEISSKLRLRVEAFIEMRKKIKKPLTLKALQIVMVRLSEFSTLEEEQIKILENSIVGGWPSVYPLKENQGQKSQGQKKDEELNDVLRRFVQKGE